MPLMLHRYRFENSAVDGVGGNDGAITGSYGNDSAKEGTYYLDVDSYVDADAITSILGSSTAKFSFSFWIRTEGADDESWIISDGSSDHGFTLVIDSLGYSKVKIRDIDDVSYNYWYFNGISLVLNQWNHVVCTYDYSQALANRVKFYTNGIQRSAYSTNLSSLSNIRTMDKLQIGDASHSYFQIDDFRIYSGVITLEEINLIYDNNQSALKAELEALLPTDKKPEVAFLKALKGLLPKGYLWGFSVGAGDSVTVIQDNVNPSVYNEYQDHINDGAYVVWQNNIFSTIGLSFSSSYLGILLSVFAHEIYRLQEKMYGFYAEKIPGLSIECLEDWERVTNEPDPILLHPELLTQTQRQIRVHRKIYGENESQLNNDFYIEFAINNYGVAIEIIEISDISSPFRVGSSRVGDRLNSALSVATIRVNVLDGPYDEDIITELQAFFEKLKPSHVVFVWTGI